MVVFTRSSSAVLPTKHGDFTVHAYRETEEVEHLALVHGAVDGATDALVRVHSECLTGDVFGSRRCDCGEQLELALQRIAQAGSGVLIYLRGQEGRGIGLLNKIAAYAHQDEGLDTVDANLAIGQPIDAREYDAAATILRELGVTSIRLMTNNPRKVEALRTLGINVVERLPHETASHPHNEQYLNTKRDRMGHELVLPPSITGGSAPGACTYVAVNKNTDPSLK